MRAASRDGALVLGTPASSAAVPALGWAEDLRGAGPGGLRDPQRARRRAPRDGDRVAGRRGRPLRRVPLPPPRRHRAPGSTRSEVRERPRIALRMLDHWDNLDGSIERGYAGRSLWKWDELPGRVDPRVVDYARANASLGINATVLNNVNAKADSLTAPYLKKAAAIADALRPYGIRVFLSANFAAPRIIGGLPKSDPLDPAVARLWKDKADEIYKVIPDFGGFLVKANSEGQPGPQDYKRTHADGANVLADAVAPHGGIVMWRAFVYDADGRPRPRQARLPRVRAARRDVPRQRVRAGQERPPRLHAARALPPDVRRDAEDAAPGRAAGHAGVPRPLEPPRVPGADVEGVPGRGHLREGARLDRREGGGRHACTATRAPASPASPTRATTATGPGTTWPRRTGTRSAGSPGTRRSRPRRSPTSGSA